MHLQRQSRNDCPDAEKNAQALGRFQATIAPAQADDVLEVDELFTFVQNKHHHRQIWIVLCRRTCQIVAFFIGDGSMTSVYASGVSCQRRMRGAAASVTCGALTMRC